MCVQLGAIYTSSEFLATVTATCHLRSATRATTFQEPHLMNWHRVLLLAVVSLTASAKEKGDGDGERRARELSHANPYGRVCPSR